MIVEGYFFYLSVSRLARSTETSKNMRKEVLEVFHTQKISGTYLMVQLILSPAIQMNM
jgi:hypothetical protein